jgi:hypothetical protein
MTHRAQTAGAVDPGPRAVLAWSPDHAETGRRRAGRGESAA